MLPYGFNAQLGACAIVSHVAYQADVRIVLAFIQFLCREKLACHGSFSTLIIS